MIIVYHIHEKKISCVYVGRIQSDVRNASLRGSDFDDILPCKKEMAGDPSYRNATETIFVAILVKLLFLKCGHILILFFEFRIIY